MKITFIHGTHTQEARKRYFYILDAIKKRGWEVIYIEKGNAISLIENLSSISLFEQNKLFVVSDTAIFGKKEMLWLKDHSDSLSANMLILHEGEAGKKLIQDLGKNVKEEIFTLPKTIFNFLDSLTPRTYKQSLLLFHQLLEQEAVEFVFALMVTHIRDLCWAKNGVPSFPSWRVQKLRRQASIFSEDALPKLIQKMCEIDINAKTSKGNLTQSIDLLLSSGLK